ARRTVTASHHLSFFFPHIDVAQNRLHGGLAYHRAHVIRRILAGAYPYFLCPVNHTTHEIVIDFLRDDRPRARRAFLSLIAECRLHHAFDRGLDVGLFIDNDGILAAHFQYGALDPDLPR